MLNKNEYYGKIDLLTPSLQQAQEMANLLRHLLNESVKENCSKDTLYFLSKREVFLREALRDSIYPDLDEYQLHVFDEVQTQVLQYLRVSQQVAV